MKNKQIIKLQPNSKISINENNELIIETEIDPCEGVIYTTMYNNGNSTRIANGTLELYRLRLCGRAVNCGAIRCQTAKSRMRELK